MTTETEKLSVMDGATIAGIIKLNQLEHADRNFHGVVSGGSDD